MKPLWMAAAACAVLASACSKSEPDAAPAVSSTAVSVQKQVGKQVEKAANAATYPRVEIATNAGLFWFEPRLCLVMLEPGRTEVTYMIEGAGKDPENQPVYVSISDDDSDPTTGPDLRINIGTDQPRKTPEVAWIASPYETRVAKATATVNGKKVEVQSAVFTHRDELLTVDGSIRVDCTKR